VSFGLIAIGWIVPPLLILWRWQREPSWFAYIRYAVAVLVVWQVVMMVISHDTMIRVHEARARGEIDGSIADTGSNAAAFMAGWIPGVIYAALLGVARWVWLWSKQKRGNHAVA
jgi:hypothetical protein